MNKRNVPHNSSLILHPSSLPKIMTPEKWNEVKEIFNEAVELSGEERADFLAGRINGNDEMRGEVEKLLASDENAETLFDGKSLIAPEGFKPDEQIGNYRILQKIGEGGMGAVFLAERADLKQRVALKIIRRSAASDVILRRFRREQEILASLEHPNIARLLDVGVSNDGTPFLAMEYVEGKDLSEYCHDKNLSVNERLKLFRKVCEAVAYAHSRLIVHRDLKPSNIFVNEKGEPKLLDFGISKLLDETESDEKGTVTSFGMLTPNYASPEQFRGETVSTATDIYSLGVILYEMLTNRLPYDVSSRRLDEVAKIVCDTNPPRPSEAAGNKSKISTISPKAETADVKGQTTNSDERGTNYKSSVTNPKFLRGDLDNIILKALRKEPDRRYSSVEKFSDDVRRHLEGLPVTARPDTFSYRAEKFIARNRFAIAAGLIIVLTLLGGVAATSWQAVRAERQRAIAEQQKQETDKRFKQVRELANNIIFKYHDEIANLQGATKVRETLVSDAVNYLDSLASEAGDDAAFRGELSAAYLRVGDVQGQANQANLGDTKAAKESYQKAIDLLEPFAADSANPVIQTQLLDAYSKMAGILLRDTDARAQEYVGKALALGEKVIAANPDQAAEKIRLAQNLSLLAESNDTLTESNENYRRALASIEPVVQQQPENVTALRTTARIMSKLASNLYMRAYIAAETGKTTLARPMYDESATFNQRAIEYGEKALSLTPQDARITRSLEVYRSNISMSESEIGQTTQALQIQNKMLADNIESIKKDAENATAQIDMAETKQMLARTLSKGGNFAEAFKYFQESLNTRDDLIKSDPNNADLIRSQFLGHIQYGDALLLKGETENAIKAYQNAYARFEKADAADDIPDDNPFLHYAEGLMNLKIGDCYKTLAQKNDGKVVAENWQKALSAYQKALNIWQQPNVVDAVAEESRQDILDGTAAQIAECEQIIKAQS